MEWIAAIVGAIASIIAAIYKYKSDKNSDVKKQIEAEKIQDFEKRIKETEAQLVTAMETCITDVPNLRMKLAVLRKQLSKIRKAAGLASLVLFSVFLSGCWTNRNPVIVGERIFTPKPGDVVTVPELKKPAKQWYLIDDVAMLGVLGVDKPVTDEDSITGVNEAGKE